MMTPRKQGSKKLVLSVALDKTAMDTEIYILYGALFVVIFLGLLFSLAKGLGDSKNFSKPKEKKNADNKKKTSD